MAYPSAFSGHQPWEDSGEAVALTVLVCEEDANIEDPGQYRVCNGCWVEEGNHVVSSQDHNNLDNAERVKGRQEDEREDDIEDIPAGDVVRCTVSRGHRRLRGDGTEEEVEHPSEDKVERKHAEENRYVGAEGPELTVRVVDFPAPNPAR